MASLSDPKTLTANFHRLMNEVSLRVWPQTNSHLITLDVSPANMEANHTPDWLIEASSSNTSRNVIQQQISYTNLSLRTLDHDSKSILPTNYSYPNLTCPVEVDHAPPVFWYDVLALFTIIGFPISLISNAIIIYLFTRWVLVSYWLYKCQSSNLSKREN